MAGTVYLTVEQVIKYHDIALSIGGGGEGVFSYPLLESAVNSPRQTYGSEDLYPSIGEKAACYGFSIAENQAFIEGNKRTAAIAMLSFLELNDYGFNQSDEEIEEMFVSLGKKQVDRGEFIGWVMNHAKPKP